MMFGFENKDHKRPSESILKISAIFCKNKFFLLGAEALLERHQEHRGEIDARGDSFAFTPASDKALLEKGPYASDEVKEKLSMLDSDKRSLIALWDERRILYEQCMDLQLFYRDTEQVR